MIEYGCAMLSAAARIAALLLAGAVIACAPANAASPRVFGGQPVGVASSAPFSVAVVSSSATVQALCSGSIIDQTHVLTAAHCTRDEQGQPWPAGGMIVVVGTTSLDGSGLVGFVQSVRVHPAYNPATGEADVAVLQVPPIAPGATIAPIPLVAEGAAPAPGTPVRVHGWGDNAPGGAWDGVERMLDLTVGSPADCWSGVAATGCARADTGSPCPGDSGSAVVRDGVAVGVLDIGVGPECSAGAQLGFADLSAPGIARFVHGDDNPPPLPFTTGQATLTPPALSGGTAVCAAPQWTNAATTSTVFFHADGGAVVQSGPSTAYAPKPSDAGHQLGCRSVAQAAGGSASADATATLAVLPSRLSVRAGRSAAAVSYSGAPGLGLSATLLTAKGHQVWTHRLGAARRLHLKARPGLYRLCVAAPSAGQYAGALACTRWRAPKRHHH